MQIIGARAGSSFRVNADYFEEKPAFTPGVDPTTGGPVMVVNDNTDDPASAPNGQRYVVDCDPASNTYRRVILVGQPVQQQQQQQTQQFIE